MEIKSKFNVGEIVFTECSDNKIVSYIVTDIQSYSNTDGFTYELLRCDEYKEAVKKKKTLSDIRTDHFNRNPFEYIREKYLYSSKLDFIKEKQELADKADKEKYSMLDYPSFSDYFYKEKENELSE